MIAPMILNMADTSKKGCAKDETDQLEAGRVSPERYGLLLVHDAVVQVISGPHRKGTSHSSGYGFKDGENDENRHFDILSG